jgi:hypothetical protein
MQASGIKPKEIKQLSKLMIFETFHLKYRI